MRTSLKIKWIILEKNRDIWLIDRWAEKTKNRIRRPIRMRTVPVWLKYWTRNYVVISYILIYIAAITALRSVSFGGMGFRSTSPAYPFILLVVLSFVFYAYQQIKWSSLKPVVFSIIAILCVLFLTFQANNSLSFESPRNSMLLNISTPPNAFCAKNERNNTQKIHFIVGRRVVLFFN